MASSRQQNRTSCRLPYLLDSRQQNRTSCRLPYLLDVPLSFYEWTRFDWQRWAPDCIPVALQSSHHDSMISNPSCLQDHDEWLWITLMELELKMHQLQLSMELDEEQLQLSMELDEDAAVPASGAFMELDNVAAAETASDHLQANHHMPPVGTQVAANAGVRPSDHPQPQQQNLAPPPFVPPQNNNARAQQPQQQHQPRSFPEDGPLRNIADLLNCRPSFLLSKKLTSTDTNLSQCRLSVPKRAVRANFRWPIFSEEDIDKFNSKDGLELTAFDQNGEEYAMRFKLWKSCGTYILLGKWKEFLENNKLQGKEEAEVCVWATRHPQTGRIIFFMTVH
ncbi:putative B3 domain-containing protein [Nymphaea thermarum]|nr:putative B3 domain-containing protein [Nymphaea thermarum]